MQKVEQTKSLIILNFHHVSEDDQTESLLTVSKATLREHFQIVSEAQVRVANLQHLEMAQTLPKFQLAITVDDGSLSDYEIILPMLKEFNLPATFFPITGQIGNNGKMNWQQIKHLLAEGFEIGSHGNSHDILTRMSIEAKQEELLGSKKLLEDKLGTAITSFAFPYGRYDADLLERSKQAGYKKVFTTGLKINSLVNAPYLLFRWNISNKTQPEMLRQVIHSQGQLSPALEVHNRLKAITQRMMGKDPGEEKS